MKLALVHEWLTNLAGSERVLLAMHDLWPDAPVYTSLYAPEALPPEYGPDRLEVRTSRLQHLPGATRRWRWLLPLMPAAFESFDLSGYDVVVSSSHQCAKGIVTGAETRHLCYCYTPIRYVWEMPHAYLADMPPLQRAVFGPVTRRLRLWDYCAAQRVDRFIAISETVRRRIAKHYRRESVVIHPPVDTARFAPAAQREEFYLVVSRFVGYKRVEQAAAACAELRRPLKIVGVGPDEGKVRAAAGPEAEFLGQVDDATLAELYGRARGLLFPGVEDFGLTPVEAQAAGCPVIAHGRGGATETVLDGETGVLYDEPTAAGLRAAIERFETLDLPGDRCRANAVRFDLAVFREKMLAVVEEAERVE